MREIKCRGFSIDNQKWVYGHYLKDTTISDWHYILWFDAKEDIIVRDEIYPESLGQFTGIKSKDDLEIYEGDIVRCLTTGNSTVEFKAGCLGLVTDGYFFPFYDIAGHCEILGNIFDSPDKVGVIG